MVVVCVRARTRACVYHMRMCACTCRGAGEQLCGVRTPSTTLGYATVGFVSLYPEGPHRMARCRKLHDVLAHKALGVQVVER